MMDLWLEMSFSFFIEKQTSQKYEDENPRFLTFILNELYLMQTIKF